MWVLHADALRCGVGGATLRFCRSAQAGSGVGSCLVQLVAFGGLVLGGSLWNLVWICQQPRGAGGCDLGDEERERANAVERIQLLELQRGGCLRERRRLVEWAIFGVGTAQGWTCALAKGGAKG